MKIPVESLSETPQPFASEIDADWWQRMLPQPRGGVGELAKPIRFAVDAHRMGEDLYLEGHCEGEVEVECARCLARYRHRLRDSFRLILEPAGERVPADPESAAALKRDGVCLGEEIEVGWFRGGEIELEAFFVELVSLALPVKPLCREDCPGLCPHCGANLSDGPCGCAGVKTNSPFAVLESLRGGSKEGEN